ncbi:hypothetical protein GFV12_01150 [Desulfurobacterium thermolithotrophum]|uniref:hypothetical protein n=1 Tax=Desulfurobacterium thermolithotrophum TaxID=64160 RepID=UPI0013D22B8B|nr:hypothetical protein [Desulfurobacterium thermolithotrophum]
MGIDKFALTLGLGIGIVTSQAIAAISVPGYEGELKTQVEFREDIKDRDSIPFDTYLKLDIRDLKGNSDLHFYGKLWKDLGYGTDWNADIYQLFIEIPFENKQSFLSIGRQFISEGFETYIADAVKYTHKLKNGLRYTFYLGKPRFFEPNTPDGDDFLAGFKFDYKGYFFGFEHLRNDGSVKKSSFVVGNYKYLSREFSYYTRFEIDAAHGEFVDANFGFNYYPTRKLRINIETEYYDPSYTYDSFKLEDPIFSLFSSGRQLRFTQSSYYDITEKWQLFESYTFSDLQRSEKDNGHLAKAGFVRDTWFENGLIVYGALLYGNSWVGTLRGLEFGFTKWINSKLTFVGSADIARYDKITYGKHWANAFYLRGIYSTTEFSNLELGLEDRINEDFKRDMRIVLRYNYLFFGGKDRSKEEKK